MKKRKSDSRELSFDFDTPLSPEPKPTVSAKSVGFQTEIPDAEQYRWGRSPSVQRVNVLTADEVMGRGKRTPAVPVEKEPVPVEKEIPMTQAKPSVKAEDKLSPAARMVLHLMQDNESVIEAPARSIDTPAEQPVIPSVSFPEGSKQVVKAVERRIVPEFSDLDDEKEETPAAEPVKVAEAKTISFNFDEKAEKPEPVIEEEPKVEENSVEQGFNLARKAFVESFELDNERLNDVVDTATTENLEKTAVFSSVAVESAPQTDSATKSIDFDFDFDLPSDIADDVEANDEVETIEDYRSVEDADAIYTDFMRRKTRLVFRSAFTAVLAALLLILTFVKDVVPFGQPVFFTVMTVLLGLGALVNFSIFSSVVSLIKGKFDADFAPMFALVASIIQSVVVGLTNADGIKSTSMVAAVVMITLVFNCLGKLYTVRRVLLNFDAVANEETKNAVQLVGSPASTTFADPSRVGESLVFGRHRVIDLKNFIGYSLSSDPYERMTFKFMIISLSASVVAALLSTFVAHGNVAQVITAFATIAAICAPFSSLISTGRNLFKVCRRLRNEGAMLTGYQAAEDISEANVVSFASDELFSDDCVSLYNFKTFHDFPIDTAIITAAALTRSGNSPLAGVFNQIVATNSGKLPLVDTVIYEDKMGLTGWVNDRKTLLGNRMILESHNIETPPISLDKKIVSAGKFPVYLAVDDKLVAIFIVGYTAKRSLLYRIRRLINTGVSLLVDTVDPNVTEAMIADCYGIPRDAVIVMSSDSARRYRENYSPSETEQARLISTSTEGYIDGYLASYNLRQSASFCAIVTAIMVCIGVALALVLPLLNLGNLVNVATVLALHAVNYIFLYIANLFYRF